MPVQVLIPTPLQKSTNNEASAEFEATSINELIAAMNGRYPGIQERLCDESGTLRRFLNIYVNGEDIRFTDGLQTAVADGGEVQVLPAVAGGA